MIELAQFHEMFFAECDELLSNADAALSSSGSPLSLDVLAELRRCAHSINGGSSTFGFRTMGEVAGELESVLAAQCAAPVPPRDEDLDTLAFAFSVLGDLSKDQRSGSPTDITRSELALRRLRRLRMQGSAHGRDERGEELGSEEHDREHGEEHREERENGAGVERVFDVEFSLSRTLPGCEILVEDMLEGLGRIGRVVSVYRPGAGDHTGRWRIELGSAHAEDELRHIVERVADPDSLSILCASDAVVLATDPYARRSAVSGVGESPVQRNAARLAISQNVATTAVPGAILGRDVRERNHLVFVVAAQRYAVSADKVDEVRPCGTIRALAGAPDFVIGITDLREEFIPVVDMRRCLGLAAAQVSQMRPLLVVHPPGGRLAVLVDEVEDIVSIEMSAIQPPHRLYEQRTTLSPVGLVRHANELLTLIDFASLCRPGGLRSGVGHA